MKYAYRKTRDYLVVCLAISFVLLSIALANARHTRTVVREYNGVLEARLQMVKQECESLRECLKGHHVWQRSTPDSYEGDGCPCRACTWRCVWCDKVKP